MARPLNPLLSRSAIAEAAIALVDSGHDLQVVPLAKQLGVGVSSLYNHVTNRADIIHAMREQLTADYPLAARAGLSWQDTIRYAVSDAWRIYAEHPRVLQLLLTVVVDEPTTVLFYESIAAALRTAGVADSEILTVVEVVDAFAFGAALDALSPDRIFATGAPEGTLAELLADHPVGAQRNERVLGVGVEILIDGITARISQATSTPSAPLPGA